MKSIEVYKTNVEDFRQSELLLHALHKRFPAYTANFDLYDWLFGKGLFGTYTSFVTRSTIELHWAQETFRLGIIYVLITILIFLITIKKIKKINSPLNKDFLNVLSILIVIKLLDSFIYSMPDVSVYNLLVFYGIMMLSFKNQNQIKG